MPIRLGQFYASMLLLVCLGINIAFFPEVREPFLGNEDPLASVKTALSELNIKARFAEIYPKIQSEIQSESNLESDVSAPPEPLVKPIEPPKKEPAKTSVSKPKPIQNESVSDPFLLPSPPLIASTPQTDRKEIERKQAEKPKPVENRATRQTAAVVPMSQPAVTQPIIAEQFKPMVRPPKNTVSAQPSAEAVWDTIDTITERPLRYD